MADRLKQSVEEWLKSVDYSHKGYIPSDFALEFVNFIKLVNGVEGEEDPSPVTHYKMLDDVATPDSRLANMCSRGLAKTTLYGEYFFLYLAVYKYLPNFGEIDWCIYVSDSIENGVKNMRKNLEFRWQNSDFLQEFIPRIKFTDVRWEFENIDGKILIVKGYGAKTGVRGSKEMGKRPTLAVLDDLISDDDARSPTVIASVEDTVYKAVDHALNPHRNKIIWSGTPFNAGDPLYKAVESGAWAVNVYPVCQIYPCTREEFKSAWPSRFDYDFVKKKYDEAKLAGKTDTFMQELMLQIMNDEDRVIDVQSEIQWYSRKDLLNSKNSYNFYITTDFAVSDKETADNSVIFVWAVNSKGFKFLVDGICKRQLMDANMDDLFRLAQIYRPLGVGIEVSGQQEGFIRWVQKEMVTRSVFFNLPSHNNGKRPGIRPVGDKFSRFMLAVPWIKGHTVFLPEEMRDHPMVEELVLELSQVTKKGFKSRRDDCLDGVSQLADIPIWLPGEDNPMVENEDTGLWGSVEDEDDGAGLDSYVV